MKERFPVIDLYHNTCNDQSVKKKKKKPIPVEEPVCSATCKRKRETVRALCNSVKLG